jgi:protein-tyrosine-phosphatase/DNA-binding transcriptional ArsR family regulator
MTSSGQAAPGFLALAANPVRWRLLAELAGGDRRVRELTERTGQPQNLVSYHLRLLRRGGLVGARRSSFDARDTYYHLDLGRCADALREAGAALHPALRLAAPTAPDPSDWRDRRDRPDRPVSVLFACTGNSARSPIAEALLSHRAAGRIEVTSAGSHPKQAFHPHAVRVLRESYGLDVGGRRPQHLDRVAGRRFDHVITLCDRVREACPGLGVHPTSHWSLPDPAGDADVPHAFARVAAELDTRITQLLPVLAGGVSPGGHDDR